MSSHLTSEGASFLRPKVVADRIAGMRNVEIATRHGILPVAVGHHLRKAIRFGEATAEQLRLRPYPKQSESAYNQRWIDRVKTKTLVDERGCWLWQGFKNYSGYGLTTYRGANTNVHRAMYQAHFGVRLETEQYVLHRCDVRNCANPDHLFIGSAKDNNADCAKKGRHYEGSRNACERGHEFTTENTYVARNGSRNCRECQRIRMRGYWHNGKAKERQKRYREKLRTQKMGASQ